MSSAGRPTHLDDQGRAHMVDVGAKPATARRAAAGCRVLLLPETLALIHAGDVEKGDVLATARLAGIQAAKRTAELVPLCHPLRISRAAVSFMAGDAADDGRAPLHVGAAVDAVDATGVEMEALTAASVAALTVYDMIKSVDRGVTVDGLRLWRKEGGRSGVWTADALDDGERTLLSELMPAADGGDA